MVKQREERQDPIWASAIRMFDDGYKAVMDDGMAVVAAPNGSVYILTPAIGQCSCGENRLEPDRRACKHLLGLMVLLQRQEAFSKIRIGDYKGYFGVWDEDGELIAVTVYRRGALSLAHKVSSLSVCPECAVANEVL